MHHVGLTTGEAARYLGRHVKTLQTLDRSGVLPAQRTSTGRRYWQKAQLDAYLGRVSAEGPQRVIAHCRVSSQAQRPDLKNQRATIEDFCVATGRANVEYIEEIGGGLNFKRKFFLEIVDAIARREVAELIVAHRDRLSRFGFELLAHLCEVAGCKLTVINVEKLSPEAEMVQDLMTIVHCFSSRLYGLRNYKKTLKAALAS